MSRLTIGVVVLGLALATAPLAAQPEGPATAITSDEDLEARYQEGFAALAAGDFPGAIAAFDVVSRAGGERAASAASSRGWP